MIDKIGKIVGLLMSVVFCICVIVALSTGVLGKMNSQELQAFWAFVVILGGPIPYFFTNTVTDKADLSTPLGRFTLAGGYVISVLAFVLVNQLIHPTCPECPDPIEQAAWRRCVLDNDVADDITDARNIVVTSLSGDGYLQKSPVLDERSRVEFICCFAPKQREMSIYIGIPSRVDPARRIERVVSRIGDGTVIISVRLNGVTP